MNTAGPAPKPTHRSRERPSTFFSNSFSSYLRSSAFICGLFLLSASIRGLPKHRPSCYSPNAASSRRSATIIARFTASARAVARPTAVVPRT